MEKERRSRSSGETEPVSAQDKIARLLGIMAVKDSTDSEDKVVVLQAAGFGTAEIASMLGITPNAINVINFRLRKKKGGRSKKRH